MLGDLKALDGGERQPLLALDNLVSDGGGGGGACCCGSSDCHCSYCLF